MKKVKEKEPTDIIVLKELPPSAFEKNEVTKLVDQIVSECGSLALSGETAKERKECISLSAKVRSTKTLIDGVGKDLVSGIKKQAKEIDAQRKYARDKLTELADTLRRPATEWEEKEAQRIAKHDENLEYLRDVVERSNYRELEELTEDKENVDNLFDYDWEEYASQASDLLVEAQEAVESAIEKRTKEEAERKELEELREKQRIAEEKEKERLQAEREKEFKLEAEKRAKEETEKKIKEAEEKAKREAEEELRKAKEELAKKEREKQEAEEKKRLEEEKRQANVKHRKKINQACLKSLVDKFEFLDEDKAKEIIKAVAKDEIKNMKILY